MGRHYYMPQPYPDELIGSVFCRAGRHRGLSIKAMSVALFGTPRSRWTLLLSDRLREFSGSMGTPARELLFRHTVFPYVTAFMGAAETERLAVLLLGNNGYSLSTLDQSATIHPGIARYCAECLSADLDRFGESYWHRSHNLPLVTICPEHRMPLRGLPWAGRRSVGYSVTGPPTESTGNSLESSLQPNISAAISEFSIGLLTSRERRTPQSWAQCYRELTSARSFPLHQGTDLSSKSLLVGMREFYGEPFLRAVGLGFPIRGSAWPALMLRTGVTAPFITAKHVLLQVYLRQAQPPEKVEPQRPGRKTRDYAALDLLLAQHVNQVLSAQLRGARITVAELLSPAGHWQAFRHHRADMPRTAAAIATFKASELSIRQSGRRPRKSRHEN